MSVDREEMSLFAHTDEAETNDTSPASDGGAGLVFWLLIAMSVITFAPCMILPAWREYQTAELAERMSAQQLTAAATEIERLSEQLDAIHNDPAVVARLARRELEFKKPGETVLPVPIKNSPATDKSVTTSTSEPADWEPAQPPLPIARLTALLPRYNYDAFFCESPTRETILAMSAILFVSAFVIFWPKQEKAVPHNSIR